MNNKNLKTIDFIKPLLEKHILLLNLLRDEDKVLKGFIWREKERPITNGRYFY